MYSIIIMKKEDIKMKEYFNFKISNYYIITKQFMIITTNYKLTTVI